MVPQRAQTQWVDDMVADIKKAPREEAREIQWWRLRKEKARTQIKLKKRRESPLYGATKTRILVYVIFDYFPGSRQKDCLVVCVCAILREPSSHMQVNYSIILERE